MPTQEEIDKEAQLKMLKAFAGAEVEDIDPEYPNGIGTEAQEETMKALAEQLPIEAAESDDAVMKTLEEFTGGVAIPTMTSDDIVMADDFSQTLTDVIRDYTTRQVVAVSGDSHPSVGNIRVRTLDNRHGLGLPKYQTKMASGFDLSAAISEPIHLNSIGASAMIPTGLCFEIPPGFEAQVRPRSGLAARHGITVTNTPGTIDADYRGEIKVLLTNLSGKRFKVERGDRIAQMVICPVVQANLVEVDDLDATERGDGGFGSTGVN